MKTRNQVVAALMHWPSDTFIDHVHKLIVDNERLMQTNEWYENRLISVSEEKDRRIRELEEALTNAKEVLQWHLDKSISFRSVDQSDFFNNTANAIEQSDAALNPPKP